MIELGVNIDHVATLRQARRTYEPDPVWAAVEAQLAGADLITMHLREDRRHVQDHDLERVKGTCQVRLNMEMAATEEMVGIACSLKPHMCTLVPEGRMEITTEGGLDVAGQARRMRDVVARLGDAGIHVSAFIDADARQIAAAAKAGFGICEIHTGPYAQRFQEIGGNFADPGLAVAFKKVADAGRQTHRAGMQFNAGHALTYVNVQPVAAVDGVRELHIGHSIVSRAVFTGLRAAVAEMKRLMIQATTAVTALLYSALLLAGCATAPRPTASSASAASQNQTPPPATSPLGGRPMRLAEVIRKGDRVLFVGDEMTQQMYYSRDVAAALLALMPDGGLRFFNGGYDGATAASSLKWIDDLLGLTKPNVVFVCLGLNDAADAKSADVVADYRQNLAALVDKIKTAQTVRQIVVVAPPAVQIDAGARSGVEKLNLKLSRLAQAALETAAAKSTGYVDLFAYLDFVYHQADQTGGDPLTIAGRLPNDLGHTIIASVLLRGIGVEPAALEPVGWCPLSPRKMARVRSALAFKLQPASLEQIERCADVETALARHDELFFRAWRLAGRRPSAGTREAALATADAAWEKVDALVQQAYGGPASR